MICPYCKKRCIAKNGHAPSLKPRWKCSCNKSFDENTGKGYPPTSIPFQFIAFVLYMSNESTLEETKNYVNRWLKTFEILKVPICSKKTISLSAVYKWRKNYGETYTKLVSIEEARKYFSELIKKAHIKHEGRMTPEDQKYEIEIREIEISSTHVEVLEMIQEMAELMGENGLEFMRKYSEITELLLKSFKKRKTKQEFLVKK